MFRNIYTAIKHKGIWVQETNCTYTYIKLIKTLRGDNLETIDLFCVTPMRTMVA